jgi:glyoxylase-like metal-dependent hydrolase (beta-lactamase superfamily II)
MKYLVVPIPVNLPIRYTNALIIFDTPLTLIDPGPITPESLNSLQAALQQRGLALKDIKRILLTHGHLDHFGLVSALVDESGAEVLIHQKDADKITSINRFHSRSEYYETLVQNGMPPAMSVHIQDFMDMTKGFFKPVACCSYLGNRVAFQDYYLEVIHTPGHTMGSVCFYEEKSGILISGDCLLKEITPNPVLEFDPMGNRYHSLQELRASLEVLGKLRTQVIIPGHGELIHDFVMVYEYYLRSWKRREEQITAVLKTNPLINAYTIAQILFGDKMKGLNVFLGMSEIMGYLDYFEDRGKLIFIKDKNEVYAKVIN